MRKQWMIFAAAIMIVSMGALATAAQGPGPQGAGAQEAVQKSHAPHSYNPIKWIKKDSNATTGKSKKTKNKKPSAKPPTPDTPAKPPEG
jgi:hypothetical protein